MTRAEKRREERRKNPTYILNQAQLDQKLKRVEERATQMALAKLMYASLMVIEGHFPELIRKEVDGKNRMERFAEMLYLQLQCISDGNVTISDMEEYLNENYKIEINWQ